MHPDVGAIIGISLAGSVLLVALLFLCLLHLPWPCCKEVKPQAGTGNRRIVRPSTSSRTEFANFDGSLRNIDQLSAMDLHHQNQTHFYNATGIVNPLWQLHCTCHASGILTASQQSLNCAHYHPGNPCQCHHHTVNPVNIPADTERTGFQYFTPQLQSPSESPPPYPGMNSGVSESSHPSVSVNPTTFNNSPPPYSPKY